MNNKLINALHLVDAQSPPASRLIRYLSGNLSLLQVMCYKWLFKAILKVFFIFCCCRQSGCFLILYKWSEAVDRKLFHKLAVDVEYSKNVGFEDLFVFRSSSFSSLPDLLLVETWASWGRKQSSRSLCAVSSRIPSVSSRMSVTPWTLRATGETNTPQTPWSLTRLLRGDDDVPSQSADRSGGDVSSAFPFTLPGSIPLLIPLSPSNLAKQN